MSRKRTKSEIDNDDVDEENGGKKELRKQFIPQAQVSEVNGEISCSIEETNRLRKLLGLKPLRPSKRAEKPLPVGKVSEKNGEISMSIEETNRIRKELGLKPLQIETKEPVSNKRKDDLNNDDLRNRIDIAKRRRMLHAKVPGKSLGEGENESVSEWLKRAKQTQDTNLKRKIDNIDDSSAQLQARHEKDMEESKKRVYSAKEASGIKIVHGSQELGESTEPVFLTLKDTSVDKNEEDILEDTKLVSRKRSSQVHGQTVLSRTRAGRDANKVELEEGVLEKYERWSQQKSTGPLLTTRIEEKLGAQLGKNAFGSTSVLRPKQDYLSDDEYEELNLEKVKKHKKKKKKEKKKKEKKKKKKKGSDEDEDDLVLTSGLNVKKKKGMLEEDIQEGQGDDDELVRSIAQVRKAALNESAKRPLTHALVGKLAENESPGKHSEDDQLVISDVSSFTRRIQSVQEHKSINGSTATNAIAIPVSTQKVTQEQAHVGLSMAGAIAMLRSRGDLAKNNEIVVGRANDKKPEINNTGRVKLEYRDDQGRLLTTKEAWRQLNYQYNGTQPGYKKREKRREMLEREQALKQQPTSSASPNAFAERSTSLPNK